MRIVIYSIAVIIFITQGFCLLLSLRCGFLSIGEKVPKKKEEQIQ